MLFLTRKIGESIIIDDQITLTVSEIRGNIVKLSFDYPNTRRILRKEIHDRIQQENLTAATQSAEIKEYITTSQKVESSLSEEADASINQSSSGLLQRGKRAAK
ncbi:carbon storage regulator [Candidatus Odyssella thessalonicensis]|uniref:carbon storage regulator n=1 Tax=Candidatus Odyssella thessalonicensis TaxID=84647 RepID=UPI000225BB00|nr:carbon storage regulator [Candidatus Odyssella thessalonicensis]